MPEFHFFTNPVDIQSTQTVAMGFGPQPNAGGNEIYNLDNKFSVVSDAPVYAITKSLILYIQDANNPQALNVALLPLLPNSAGFPIKFFIYRGIRKNSIILSNDTIAIQDSSWEENNILKLIKDLQDKINADAGTSETATSSSIGYNFSTANNNTYLEKLFFGAGDSFQPLIVEAGCQIGKCIGGTTFLTMQVIMDKIGQEPKLEVLKISSDNISVPVLTINPTLPEKEKLILRFNNRIDKERILAHLDITAFYGTLNNQNYPIHGTQNDEFFNKFINKNSVYIDIRDERGYSYNHFYRTDDNMEVGFHDSSDPETVLYDITNYYTSSGWPLLILKNKSYDTDKKNFYIRLPILSGSPEFINIVSSFTTGIRTSSNNEEGRHHIVSSNFTDENIQLLRTEALSLFNWSFSDNKLGANYFLLKKSSLSRTKQSTSSDVLNNFFPLGMKSIFLEDTVPEYEFRVYTYSSINFPPIIKGELDEIFYPIAGIVNDSNNISFFTYRNETIYSGSKIRPVDTVVPIGTGIFKKNISNENLDYTDTENPAIGFLNLLANLDGQEHFELNKLLIPEENSTSVIQALGFAKSNSAEQGYSLQDLCEIVTLTTIEYEALTAALDNSYTDNQFFVLHPMYVKGEETAFIPYEKFSLRQNQIKVGVVAVNEDDPTTIDFVDFPEEILSENNPIILNTLHY